MGFCGSASPWAKGAFFLLLCALALHCAGYGTAYWMTTESVLQNTYIHTGLWRSQNCSGGFGSPCSGSDVPSEYKNGSFTCVQVMASIILVLLVIAFVVFAFYVASERFRGLTPLRVIIIVCFIAVLLSIICMIVWLTQIPTNHYANYSFGLTVFAFLLCLLAGAIVMADLRKYSGSEGRKVRPRQETPRYDFKRDEEIRNKKYNKHNDEFRTTNHKYNDEFRSYNHKHNDELRSNSHKHDDEFRRNDHKYDDSNYYDKRAEATRNYYNPNREPFIRREPYYRSPPPSYRSPTKTNRTIIRTPDVYLGTPRRY